MSYTVRPILGQERRDTLRRIIGRSRDGQETPLPPRLDLYNHSPTGYGWGYSGSGPAQLALAILSQVLDETSVLAGFLHGSGG